MIKGWLGQHDIFKATFPHASDSTIIKNCGPYPFGSAATPGARPPEPDAHATIDGLRASKRIRQSTKPVLNKLEQEWFNYLQGKTHQLRAHQLRAQAITFKLCNGVRYTPDIVGWGDLGRPICYEVKGKQTLQDDSAVKLKVAAKEYPDFDWVLVWKGDDGQWMEQKILA